MAFNLIILDMLKQGKPQCVMSNIARLCCNIMGRNNNAWACYTRLVNLTASGILGWFLCRVVGMRMAGHNRRAMPCAPWQGRGRPHPLRWRSSCVWSIKAKHSLWFWSANFFLGDFDFQRLIECDQKTVQGSKKSGLVMVGSWPKYWKKISEVILRFF